MTQKFGDHLQQVVLIAKSLYQVSQKTLTMMKYARSTMRATKNISRWISSFSKKEAKTMQMKSSASEPSSTFMSTKRFLVVATLVTVWIIGGGGSVWWLFRFVVRIVLSIVNFFLNWVGIQVGYVFFCIKALLFLLFITCLLLALNGNGVIDGFMVRRLWFLCCFSIFVAFLWRTWRTSLLGRITIWILLLPFRLLAFVLANIVRLVLRLFRA